MTQGIEKEAGFTNSRFALEKVGGFDRIEMFLDTEATNMMYMVPSGFYFGGYPHVLPKDILMRRELSLLNVSELPTVVVFPGVSLSQNILEQAREFGDKQIANLELNEMCQLYIRTRQPEFRSVGKRSLPQYSRRSLIIDCDNYNCVEYIDEGGSKEEHKYLNPLIWQSELASDTFMMIHAENDDLQRNCLHGIVGWTGPDQFALAVGDARVHARGLDERLSIVKGKLKPFLRMKGIDAYNLVLNGGDNHIDAFSSQEDEERLAKRWLKVRNDVVAFHEQVARKYGEHAMMEWRAYPNGSVQVLDVDTGF